MLRFDKALLLAKSESTYKTDPTPAAASDVIVCNNVKVEPNFELKERLAVAPDGGKFAPSVVTMPVKISFDAELIPAATALTTAPPLGRLLKACGMTETITSGTSIIYTQLKDIATWAAANTSVTFWIYGDGTIRKYTGCRGNVKFKFTTNELITLTFEMEGFYGATTSTTYPTATYPTLSPVLFNNTTVTWGSLTIFEEVEIDMGQSIQYRKSALAANGVQEIFTSLPEITGTLKAEYQEAVTYDYEAYITAQTNNTLTIQKETETGAADVQITLEHVYFDSMSDVDMNGRWGKDIKFTSRPLMSDSTFAGFTLTFINI